MRLLRRIRLPRDENSSPPSDLASGPSGQAPIDSTPSKSDKDFMILRLHLGSHTDAHPVFEASGLREKVNLGEMFRNEIMCLPQQEVMVVISAIQAVCSIPPFLVLCER